MLAIVIVNTNEYKHLKNCLPNIYSSSFKDFKVIIVDNNSTDGSLDYLRKNFPQVHIIETKKNNGYAGGNNIGMKYAQQQKADYILLLNPDTVLDKDCLKRLMEKANQKTILQPLVLLYKNRKTDLVNTAGGVLNYLGFGYCGSYRAPASKFKEEKEIPYASGACTLIPVTVLNNIGLLDESFFMYHEDTDLCWRARIAGYNIKLIPEARIWHKYSFSKNRNKLYNAERNRLTFMLKNYALKTLLLLLPIFLLNELLVCLYSIKERWFFLKIKSYLYNLSCLRKTLRKRVAIQKTRKKTDQELSSYLSPELDFEEVEVPAKKFYGKILSFYWQKIKRLLL